MDDSEKLIKICDRLSDALYNGEYSWKELDFDEFLEDCAQAISIWNITEDNLPKMNNYYLTKDMNTVERVLFFDGKNWGKTGRPDIPNDRVDPPRWWLSMTEQPKA